MFPIISVAVLGACLSHAAVAQGGDPIAFPTGYDYQTNADALQGMVKAREVSKLRRHSWFLWAGVTQPGRDGWPIWASWPTATQVFAKPKADTVAAQSTETNPKTNEPSAAELESLSARSQVSLLKVNVQHRVTLDTPPPWYEIPKPILQKYRAAIGNKTAANFPDGDLFQNNGDIMLVTEPYSKEAYDFLRATKLYERSTLQQLLNDKKTDIPYLPQKSIVLKHMYWPVKKDGLSALPVVTMSDYQRNGPAGVYIGFENMNRWTQAVAIDPSGKMVGQTASVTYLYDVRKFVPSAPAIVPPPQGPHTYKAAKVVGLSDFYYKRLSMSEFNKMSVYDRLLIDSSFYWAYGRMFEDGDFLVTIASHIATKELPNWTLQTVWWHPDPDTGAYAQDRPTISYAKGPWRHYLLNVEDGVTTTPGGDTLPIAYNPYIELGADHPVATNCRNCHIRADTPSPAYITPNGVPSALADIKRDNSIFRDKLRTDFLWTITDRAIGPSTPP